MSRSYHIKDIICICIIINILTLYSEYMFPHNHKENVRGMLEISNKASLVTLECS